MKLGIVTGLAREVDCLPHNDPDLIIACAGANPERAESISRELIEQGCGALLSFGIAGALAPELKVGDIIVATDVVDDKGLKLPSAENWRNRVLDRLPKTKGAVKSGIIYGSDQAITSAQQKSQLYEKTGALSVDMESHRMARVAASASVPFLAIRVISDDAERAIPSAALGVIGENGKPQIGRIISGLVRNPNQIPQLIQLSKDMEVAIAQLRRVPGLIGPLFRFA